MNNINKVNAKLSYSMLAFILGIIVLYPTFDGMLVKPLVYEWSLVGFWILALLGVIFSLIGYYLSEFVNKTSHECVGLGNIFSMLSFCFFIFYVSTNVYNDKNTIPTIKSITYTPINIKKGESLKLMSSIEDFENKIDSIYWKSDSSVVNIRPKSDIGYVFIPKDYDYDSFQIKLDVFYNKKIIQDSITIYLKSDE